MGKIGLRTLGCGLLVIAWLGGLAAAWAQDASDPPPPPGTPLNSFSMTPTPPEFAPDPPAAANEYHPRWEFSAELMYFLFRPPSPGFPLATSGVVTDTVPGALGQPGTTILSDASTFRETPHAGGKLNAMYWLTCDPEAMGIQASYFLSEAAANRFNASNQGNYSDPVLARPFFNAALGREDADPRAVPGAMSGNININFLTRLQGGEVNFVYNLTSYTHTGPSLFFLVGPRYMRLDDLYYSNETATDLPPAPANTFNIQDNFTTSNTFLGAQIGTQFRYRWEGVTFDLFTKVAGGNNHQTVSINGFTSVTDQNTGQVVTGNQGLYAQPSNIGSFSHNTFSLIPELSLKVAVDITPTIKLTAGYGYLYMTHAALSAEQLDRNINIQPIGAPSQVGPAFPIRPTSINQTNFWANYFSVGLELVF
jgi:hypothetical protein